MTDEITVSRKALLTTIEKLLTELTDLQEQADNLASSITDLSERVNRLFEYIEGR